MTKANEYQVSGDHYSGTYQHWDFVTESDLGYLDGTATKYIARNRRKGQELSDLSKADHYLQKLIETEGESLEPLREARLANLMALGKAYELSVQECEVIGFIMEGRFRQAQLALRELVGSRPHLERAA